MYLILDYFLYAITFHNSHTKMLVIHRFVLILLLLGVKGFNYEVFSLTGNLIDHWFFQILSKFIPNFYIIIMLKCMASQVLRAPNKLKLPRRRLPGNLAFLPSQVAYVRGHPYTRNAAWFQWPCHNCWCSDRFMVLYFTAHSNTSLSNFIQYNK